MTKGTNSTFTQTVPFCQKARHQTSFISFPSDRKTHWQKIYIHKIKQTYQFCLVFSVSCKIHCFWISFLLIFFKVSLCPSISVTLTLKDGAQALQFLPFPSRYFFSHKYVLFCITFLQPTNLKHK